MGPTRKSRSNKRYSYINEVSKSRDGDSVSKKGQRKKKLSNMLGNEWSEEELERFYTAYRKHGKDWKKVATAVRNKSSDMVEALYTMNRAYLSLPEGTASVVGLIAMMTDYYSNLVRTDSEQGSPDGVGTSRKPKKRGPAKAQASKASGNLLHPQGISAPYDCLPFLKKRRSGGTRPRAVGKRTPRFTVAHSYEDVNGEKYFSPSRLALRLKRESDDDEVAHEIALALASASQRAGSPESSQTPNRRRIGDMPSPMTNAKRMHAELEMSGDMDDDDLEESMEADNGGYSRHYTMESRGVGPSARRGRKSYAKKGDFDDDDINYLDDIREACSGTEEGLVGRRKFDDEITDSKVSRSRKRSKKALFRKDEVSALDALQTLANMSLMMPDDEIDQSVQFKEEDDHVDESGLLEPLPTNQKKERRKSSGVRVKGNQLKLSRTSKASDEVKQESQQPASKVSRKKQKTIPSRIQKSDAQLNESQEVEAKDAPKEPVVKSKRSSQNATPKASLADLRREANETAMSALQLPMSSHVNFAAKRIKRKIDLEKPQKIDDIKLSDDTLLDLKEKVSNCLLNPRLRRLCTFEWFYSAIDYPWFAKREFVEYLYHVGLGHVPRLTRVEWGVIRSSLGKPRRFSEQFLKEEKEKLNQYRNSVRAHYTELRSGTREGLPTDLAKPLSVAQRVIAIHPSTREIHDGSVLTVDHDKCRIQFDRPELGVEFVLDIDCMPLNPVENMPTAMSGYSSVVNKLFENFNDLRMNVQQQVATKDQRLEGYMLKSSIQNPSLPSPTNYMLCNLLKQVTPTIGDAQTKSVAKETGGNQQTVNSVMSVTMGQNHAVEQNTVKEDDVQAIAAFTRALDKKQAILEELKRMHDDVSEDKTDSLSALKESEPFKKIYAAVLTQLSESNAQLESALTRVRQRNTYPGSCPPPWAKSTHSQVDSVGMLTSSADRSANKSQESGHVTEIVESSRTKANSMVDAAIRAMKSLKLGGNNFEKIEEAIDYVNDRVALDDSHTRVPLRSSTNIDSNGSLSVLTTDSKIGLTTTNEIPIPSELISNCVATLFMIQKCTERQFPPADVAAILDSAVTSLKPSCSQNLPVYDEIQKCMGIIRNQIMALVPT